MQEHLVNPFRKIHVYVKDCGLFTVKPLMVQILSEANICRKIRTQQMSVLVLLCTSYTTCFKIIRGILVICNEEYLLTARTAKRKKYPLPQNNLQTFDSIINEGAIALCQQADSNRSQSSSSKLK
jgi:hypothetical protein